MKALSLWQPWASLIAVGEKRIETRSWSTKYRGPLLIHAGKTREGLMYSKPLAARRLAAAGTSVDRLPYGAFVALVDLVGVIPVEGVDFDHPDCPPHERAFGNYAGGRFGWLLSNVRPLSAPVAARGRQGLWSPPVEDVERAEAFVPRTLFEVV